MAVVLLWKMNSKCVKDCAKNLLNKKPIRVWQFSVNTRNVSRWWSWISWPEVCCSVTWRVKPPRNGRGFTFITIYKTMTTYMTIRVIFTWINKQTNKRDTKRVFLNIYLNARVYKISILATFTTFYKYWWQLLVKCDLKKWFAINQIQNSCLQLSFQK